ncbi:MAG: osmotically inducible protein OsmC [Euryarchaeota archaeon RBG_13_31_8]|nr:MAG: osmotically inducible protein OsmC [Euryarchaeota archaeon RBG_13_31_8]
MKATIKQIKGCSFVGKADSNHWVTIDTPKETCGFDAACTPMELVLIALGSCSGADVVSILDKKKVSLNSFEINIDAEQADSYPKVFTKINLEYVFYGQAIKSEHVERAISLSKEKYCSVLAMLKNSVTITSSYKIVNNENTNKKDY